MEVSSRHLDTQDWCSDEIITRKSIYLNIHNIEVAGAVMRINKVNMRKNTDLEVKIPKEEY